MSETEYGRLSATLSEIKADIAVMKERMLSYPELKKGFENHEIAIKLLQQSQANMQTRCDSVQSEKKSQKVSWGDVKGKVFVGVAVGAIMLALNIIVAFIK